MSDLQDELRAVAREMLAKGRSDPTWAGLEVPEDFDGAGVSFAELAVVIEELGRATAPGGLFATAVLGVEALRLVDGAGALLRGVATGEETVAVAFSADADAAGPTPAPFSVRNDRVTGSAPFVLDGVDADRLLLVARDEDGGLVLVEAGADAQVEPLLDTTRSFASVHAADVKVDRRWRFTDPGPALQQLFDRAALGVALDSLGIAGAMLDTTVDYAKKRTQFDRPIGSFQAVKHQCADMLVTLTVARELVGLALAGDSVAVAMAKAYATQAAVDIAGTAMQLHGGIGYTEESGIHRYLKRATLNRALHGTPAAHHARLAERHR